VVTEAQTTEDRGSRGRQGSRGAELARVLEENGTLVVVLTVFAILLVVDIRKELVTDGWMALLSGRQVAQHGLPSHDALTVWAHGRRWVDQQWLAQLILYELSRLGGIKLVMLVHAIVSSSAIVAIAIAARRFGASARAITWVCVPAMACYFYGASVMRPQTLTFILFALLLWLLAADEVAPSRRTYLAFPLLVLWANLHGSVVIAAAIVSGYGLLAIVRSRWSRSRPAPGRFVLVAAPWACVFATPYALHLPGYYRVILFSGDFGSYVTEWAPTTLTPATAPLFLLILGGIWLIGRSGSRVTLFQKLLFVATAILAFQAIRNIVWFALVCLLVLPKLVDALRPPVMEPQRLNRLLATAMLIGLCVSVVGVSAKDTSWFLENYPDATAAAAATAAGSHDRVFANESYADWLVWTHPSLAGRIAFDSRFELLTHTELKRIAEFRNRVSGWRTTIRGYDVLVLDPEGERDVWRTLVRSGAKVISRSSNVIVLRAAPPA
jgi:hypothetical protein